MHVGIFIPALRGGGAEFVARRWIAEMDRLGHRVTVYTYQREQLPAELPKDVIVRRFGFGRSGARHVLLPLWLHRHLTADRPEVLLSLMTHGNLVALLLCAVLGNRDVPLVVSERNMPSLQYRDAHGRNRLMIWAARRLYRYAAGVVAISHPVAGDLVSSFHVAPSRLYVVPNPVIADSEVPEPTHVPGPKQSLHIAFVGRLVDQKRPHLFLTIVQTIEQRGTRVRATIIGDGPLRQQAEEESAELGLDVSFVGWQEPWWASASDIDCIVVTARFEGLANVLVEAAAAQIPAVACSRALGVADAILPGITGELVMTDDARAYIDGILRATAHAHSPRSELGGWLSHFSTGRSTSRLLDALAAAREQSR